MTTENLYDAIIVGAGPSGLTAAIYLARARYRVLVVEKDRIGGQITITHEVVNYPGIMNTSGENLTNTMKQQAINFGAEFLSAEVTDLQLDNDIKQVITTKGQLQAYSVLIATGANPRVVGFKGEESFKGKGVAYCATCDGEFFTGKELLVIGGGYASAEEAMFLTRYAKKITILVRKDQFSCAKSIADEVQAHDKIKVLFNHELESIEGNENGIYKAHIINNKNNESFDYTAEGNDNFGVFVFAGYVPNTSLVKDKVSLNEQGYILTNSDHQTNVDGVFAAGDVCTKNLRQVVTATADGALAAVAMEKVCAHMHEKTGVIPQIKVQKQEQAPAQTNQAALSEAQAGSFISQDMIPQLEAVYQRMENKITLEILSDNSDKSQELIAAMQELCNLMKDKLELKISQSNEENLPCVRVLVDGLENGVAFHGIPGGHEFTSFILGLYNSSGKGQALEPSQESRIGAINQKVDLKVLISLSCTMCPELVIASQKIACLNKNVKAHVYDLNLFADLRTKYKVMSVPCLVVNDQHISFGKKNMDELLAYLEKTLA